MAAKTLLAMLASALVLSASAITCPSLAAGDIVSGPTLPFSAVH
jgi:hypothetical protein